MQMQLFVLFSIYLLYPLLVLGDEHYYHEHTYHNHAVLDPYGYYNLEWCTFDNNETITFRVEVKTKGWIGFGLSPTGGMKGSDLVIGWVSDNGTVYFQDRFAHRTGRPLVDKSQDWTLDEGYENETHTVFKFSRPYVTCDREFDLPVTRHTQRVVWAYFDKDPPSIDKVQYHTEFRGSKSLRLRDNKPEVEVTENVEYWDIKSNRFLVPDDNVETYWGRIIKSPHAEKHHAIKFEPLIYKGHERLVHHVALYRCNHSDPGTFEQYLDHKGWLLSGHDVPQNIARYCQSVYFIWLTGGSPVTLPKEVGYSVGEDETTYFLFEIHYHNHRLAKGIYDYSGIRVHLTHSLRKFDADTLTVGSVSNFRLLIPPRQEEYTISGHCDTQWFKEAWPQQGIKVFGSVLHGHYLAQKIKVRHFRSDKELAPITEDNHFDFNYQDTQFYDHEQSIEYGDQLTVECTYNSMLRNTTTLGGFSLAHNEVCYSWLLYYPRIRNVKPCTSAPTLSTILAVAEIDELWSYDGSDTFRLKSPYEYQNTTLVDYLESKSDWDDVWAQKTQYLVQYGKQHPQCYWSKGEDHDVPQSLIGYPYIKDQYVPKDVSCQKNSIIN